MSVRKISNFGGVSAGDIVVPIALQNLTIEYKNEDLIGEQVFPIVPVATPQSKILKFAKASLFRTNILEGLRAEGTSRKRIDYKTESQYVNPEQISYETVITDELMDIAAMPGQQPLQPLQQAIELLVKRIDLDKEKLIADTIFGNSWMGEASGGVNPSGGAGFWGKTDTTNTFVKDIFAAKDQIRKASGKKPNVLEIDYGTYMALHNDPVISDRIKYTMKDITTADILAELLQLEEVIVGSAIYDTTPEKAKETSASFVAGDVWSPSQKGNAFLYHRAAPGLRVVSAGFQFRLPYMGAMRFVRGYRDESVGGIVYQMTEQVEVAPVALDVGKVWKNTILA